MASTARTPSYPYAPAPDTIRANQKDTYFQALLLEHLSTILRNLKGARFLHNYASEAHTSADLLYLGLTTLIGNRTLGEEYCDIVQVQGKSLGLPSLKSRAAYILCTILTPYALARILPVLRRCVRAKLDGALQVRATSKQKSSLRSLQQYVVDNLDTITSPAPLYAVSLATFYFTGAYYHLSKRLLDLRYIFTRQLTPADQRVGYEVLGILLVFQLAVQSYLHLQTLVTPAEPDLNPASTHGVSLDPNSYTSNNALLFDAPARSSSSKQKLSFTTHTPATDIPHVDLVDKDVMRWIAGRQARKCTLCLEPMKEPSANTCGHTFCWTCISDWCREKPECPLCRQTCMVQHVLPLRQS